MDLIFPGGVQGPRGEAERIGKNWKFYLLKESIRSKHRDEFDFLFQFLEKRLGHIFGRQIKLELVEKLPSSESAPHIIFSIFSPLIDGELLKRTILVAEKEGSSLTIVGAVPGTTPLKVHGGHGQNIVFRDSGQQKWNSQLNLRKLKRLKIFKSLSEKVENLYAMPTDEILHFLSSSEGVRLVLSYGEEVQLEKYSSCPNCCSENIYPVYTSVSQPRIGFLTKWSEYYFQCGKCELVFLNPCPIKSDLFKYYDWYDKEMAQPLKAILPAESQYINHYQLSTTLIKSLPQSGSVVDLGGGQGHFSVHAKMTRPDLSVRVVDFECNSKDYLKNVWSISAESKSFIDDDIGEGTYDLVTMWEVVEHLRFDQIEPAFLKVFRALRPGGFFVFSTPDFGALGALAADFWCAFVPQHLTVLSRPVLRQLWERVGFQEYFYRHESLLLSRDYGDLSYVATTSGSEAGRAEAEMLSRLKSSDKFGEQVKQFLIENGAGSEMVVALRKV